MEKTISYLDNSAKVTIKNPAEFCQAHWANGKFYESSRNTILQRWFNQHKGGVFVDCGAFIGNHALFATNVCGASVVHAFEPNPTAFKHLEENIILNNLQDGDQLVYAHQIALGASKRKVGLKLSDEKPEKGGQMMTTVDTRTKDKSTQMDKLDNYVEKCDVLKIDVEGYGLSVLKGAKNLIKNSHPVIYIETDDRQFPKVRAFLEGLGYEVVKNPFDEPFVFNNTPTYCFV